MAITFFTSENSKSARDLVGILREANQEVPPELQDMVRYSGGGGGGFRGRGRGRGRGGGFGGRRFGGPRSSGATIFKLAPGGDAPLSTLSKPNLTA